MIARRQRLDGALLADAAAVRCTRSPAASRNVEAFLFSTRLTRVTRDLSRRGGDAAAPAVARAVPDWGGGTRIGEALRTFNRRWARRVIGTGPSCSSISDGWDRGDPACSRARWPACSAAAIG